MTPMFRLLMELGMDFIGSTLNGQVEGWSRSSVFTISGQLTAATLDAFREEPLPAESMLWRHPRITIMPHVARRALPQDSVPQVVENIRRARAGVPLQLVVDRQVGY